MRIVTLTVGAAALFVSGCATPMLDMAQPEPIAQPDARATLTQVGNVPASVASLAASGQDLSTARFMLEDGCYWYEHSGPVEVTLVPLRSAGGSPICLKGYT